jgi:TRAP-type C4-dicarboxylate transport system permease small subunit
MFRKIETCVSIFVQWLAMILLVVMTLDVCMTVFTRYCFSYTPSWSEDLALLCMIWFGFLAMALGVRDNGHLSITLMDLIFPKSWIRPLDVFKYLCRGGFGVFMVYYGYDMVVLGSRNTITGMSISSAWQYAAVPLSGVAIVVYSFEGIVCRLFGWKTSHELEEEKGA